MQASEALVMLTLFIGGFATLFGIFYLRSRENMSLIERGINPREGGRKANRSFITLRYGMLLAGAGLGLLIAFLVDTSIKHPALHYPGGEVYYQEYPQIYFSLIALFGGLGLIISNRLEKQEWDAVGKAGGDPSPVRKPQPYDEVIS